MGLIESDTLITVSLYDDEHEEFVNKRMTIAECLDSFAEEGCPHAVEAEPVRHGRWVEYPECLKYENAYGDIDIVCSCCEAVFNVMDNDTDRFDYCPHCGAKMDEVKNETD